MTKNAVQTMLVSLGLLGGMVGFLVFAIWTTDQSHHEKMRHQQSRHDLKQLGLAMHNYLASNGSFPAQAICDADGKPLLSWRVAILPYLEAGSDDLAAEIYKQFHLDEPWDSPHNRALIARVPRIFDNLLEAEEGKTSYLGVKGGDCFFDGAKGRVPLEFTDGLSNAVGVVEATRGVIWTRPDDLDYDPENPKKDLGTLRRYPEFFVLYADGAVRNLASDIPDDMVQAYMKINDGKTANRD